MSIYRSTVWFLKGIKEYTKAGFLAASKDFCAQDLDVNIDVRSYVITGANSGLGMATAMALAKKGLAFLSSYHKNYFLVSPCSCLLLSCQDGFAILGGTIHMVCRNREKGKEAKAEIIEKTGNQNVHLHQLNTSKPKEIYDFVRTFESSGHAVDALINNAGCMINTLEKTEDGFEMNFATNTLGTHVLTTAMIPLLLKSKQPRVITVSSGGMLTETLNTEDLQFEKMKSFDGTKAYAQNKRQQIVMTEQYAKLYPGVHFSAMHPGWADTPAVKTSMPKFYEKMKDKLRSVEEGADTVVWLAMSDAALKHASGLFFQDRKPVPTHLPLAWTRSSPDQDQLLMTKLDELAKLSQHNH